MIDLAAMLGPATRRGAICLRRALPRDTLRIARRQTAIPRPRAAGWTKTRLAAVAVCAAAALTMLTWTLWPQGHPPADKTLSQRPLAPRADIPDIPDLRPDAIAAMEAAAAATTNDSTDRATASPQELVLPTDRQRSPLARLPLRPGHRVHGPPGRRIMLAVARRFMRNDADAADALQDAFLSAHRSIGRFEGGSKLSTWLHRIVVNACLM